MVNSVIAIALNSIRQAIRSRLVISLIMIMLVTIIFLPLSIKGDGTFAGKATILLFYTLGLTVIILGTATMWSSCSAIAQEIEGQQIQLIAVKPVNCLQLWLGKWIGMLLMNGILLTIAGVTVYALLIFEVKSANLSDEEMSTLHSEVLVARKVLAPKEKSVHDKVHVRIQELIDAGKLPPDAKSDDQLFKEVENRMNAASFVVAAGRTTSWVFDIPESFNNKEKLAIRYKFSSSSRDSKPATVIWKIGSFEQTQKVDLEGTHTLYMHPDSITPGTQASVQFTNVDAENKQTIVFDQVDGIQLMKKAGSFTSNYLRSLLVIFFHLALIAALGLTAGALFSFPVATFTTCAIITISLSVHYFGVLSENDDRSCRGHTHQESSRSEVIVTNIVNGMEKYTSPSMRYQSLEKLSNGILVSWTFTLKAGLLLGLIYPAIMACLGVGLLRSRELALPGRNK